MFWGFARYREIEDLRLFWGLGAVPAVVLYNARSFPERNQLIRGNALVLLVQTVWPVNVDIDRFGGAKSEV